MYVIRINEKEAEFEREQRRIYGWACREESRGVMELQFNLKSKK